MQKHKSRDSCWVILNGEVYDVTTFLPNHPGGVSSILAVAGTDASRIFAPIHHPGVLATLPPECHLGPVDLSTVPVSTLSPEEEADEKRIAAQRALLPPAESFLLLSDFEEWAHKILPRAAWAYYASAADSESAYTENIASWSRYFFRPRVLRKINEGNLKTTVCGTEMDMPIFICPAAMARLGHPLGELNLTRAAAAHGIVQAISINASCPLDEILEAREEGQKVWFQIYLNKDRERSVELLKKVEDEGVAAVIFTVDVAWQSKRTLDRRAKTALEPPPSNTGSQKGEQGAGVAAAISGYQDTHLVWDDIDFIRVRILSTPPSPSSLYAVPGSRADAQKHTKLPIIVKGLQAVPDIILASQHPAVSGVIISNHGGRSADYAPAPIDVLTELRWYSPETFDKVDVMIDGGVRSGADVVKALALGAKAVGLGRPFLYANGTHGQQGAERVCESESEGRSGKVRSLTSVLEEEITNTMRNCGAATIDQLTPSLVGPRGPWVGDNRPKWYHPNDTK